MTQKLDRSSLQKYPQPDLETSIKMIEAAGIRTMLSPVSEGVRVAYKGLHTHTLTYYSHDASGAETEAGTDYVRADCGPLLYWMIRAGRVNTPDDCLVDHEQQRCWIRPEAA